MRRNARGKGGFTLVELIVVITVMGILAGVGVAAYSGYVKATRKGLDRQTVGSLITAIRLADAANPGMFEEGDVAVVALTKDGVKVAGKNGLSTAIAAAGDFALQYENWPGAVSGETLKKMYDSLKEIGLTDENGGYAVKDADGNNVYASYAGKADELWGEVELLAEHAATFGKDANGYLASAAAATAGSLGKEKIVSGWNGQFIHSGLGAVSDQEGGVAAVNAVRLARNYAFAAYLRSKGITDAKVLGQLENPGSFMYDGVGNILDGGDNLIGKFTDDSEVKKAAQAYIAKGGNPYSQAEVDAMTYYALMKNVDDVSSGKSPTYDPKSGDYLDNVGGYVSIAGTALSGKADWDKLTTLVDEVSGCSGGMIVVTAKRSGGMIECGVSPADADPRDGSGNAVIPEPEPTIAFEADVIKLNMSGMGSGAFNPFSVSGFDGEPDIAIAVENASICRAVDSSGGGEYKIKVDADAVGSTTVTVTVSDDKGRSATGSFTVSVVNPITVQVKKSNTKGWSVKTDDHSCVAGGKEEINVTGSSASVKCSVEAGSDGLTVVATKNKESCRFTVKITSGNAAWEGNSIVLPNEKGAVVKVEISGDVTGAFTITTI